MKSTPCGGPPPASTVTPAGHDTAGMIVPRRSRTKSCAGPSPYSCFPATTICA
jgi:hypothetical protein